MAPLSALKTEVELRQIATSHNDHQDGDSGGGCGDPSRRFVLSLTRLATVNKEGKMSQLNASERSSDS